MPKMEIFQNSPDYTSTTTAAAANAAGVEEIFSNVER